MEAQESLYFAGGNAKWCSCYGNSQIHDRQGLGPGGNGDYLLNDYRVSLGVMKIC